MSILTAIGLGGVLVDGFGIIPAAGPPGCAAGMLILVVFIGALIFLFAWLVVAGLAAWGTVLLFRRSSKAAYLLVPVNLAVMTFFGSWSPVYAGQLVWGLVVVLLALPSAAACAILVYGILAEGPLARRIAAVAVIAVVASLPVSAYATGIVYDLALALTPIAPAVTATSAHAC